MSFIEIIDQVTALLRTRGRVTYRVLKREFDLDDEQIEDLKEELIDGQELAVDKDGKVLIWTGRETSDETASPASETPSSQPSQTQTVQPEPEAHAGERRQLTVMFCDLVGSTALSEQLDPEELQTVVRTYQEVSAQIIERYEGYIAQYLGDGLLVYFGYPAAHEDDAARAIRAGLEIVSALDQARSQFPQPVQVRIGIHTGPVVLGQMGGGSRHEQLALGETPNIAARVQGQAEPDEVIISAATQRLVARLFECEDRGLNDLKGIATPQTLYWVVKESEAQSRFEAAMLAGLTPFIGREEELGLLRRRWERAQAGEGQVVLLSGEPGIGKSRLLQELREYTAAAAAPLAVACRCSAYLQNSALSPVIGHVERLLRFDRTDLPETKLHKLEQTLTTYDFVLADTMPLLANLLSLPLPDTYASLQSSPQKQKEQTLDLLVTWLRKDAERHPVRVEFEDLHWADPSTLEFLTLLVEQIPTMKALLVLTFRPEFTPPWPSRAQVLALHLDRLTQSQIVEIAEQVAGKALPAEVVEQVVSKTDGVPLFVEELTKTVVESGQLQETETGFELLSSLQLLDIPTTLQDSLRARLDRLNTAQEVAQIGATLGREFSYELLQAVSASEDEVLQQGLRRLVEADLVFQHGLPPQAQYVFKHALIQDTAYQSLLKSRRQQLHAQTAQVLEQQFAETVTTRPELLAHHYTEGGLAAQALPYWQQAGQQAIQRSANAEAINHLTQGLTVLQTLPDTPERAQYELMLQVALGAPLISSKGWATPEIGTAYARAYELCQQLGENQQLFPVLYYMQMFYAIRGESTTARELGEQLMSLAQHVQDPALLVVAHFVLGYLALYRGEFASARAHLEQNIAIYDPQQHQHLAFVYGQDMGVSGLFYAAHVLWFQGYPDQALTTISDAFSLAQQVRHPFSQGLALMHRLFIHIYRRDTAALEESLQDIRAFAAELGFPFFTVVGTIAQGWLQTVHAADREAIALLQEGGAAIQAMGMEANRPQLLVFLAEGYRAVGQPEDGLQSVAEALALVDQTGERWYEAELYRLKGELLLSNDERGRMNDEWGAGEVGSLSQTVEAEACFHKALEVSRHQKAKSLELRAATSLAYLWQQQSKTEDARQLLAEIYGWFTEGFDTADLRDAKALLDQLS